MSRRNAAWLSLPLLALAACGGRAATAEPAARTTTWEPIACKPGQHQSTPEAYYDCVDGAWVPGTAPTPTTPPRPTMRPAAPPTTAPPTTQAPTTAPPTTVPPATEAPPTVPPTAPPTTAPPMTQAPTTAPGVPTATPPPPSPAPAPTIHITCPTPKNSGADSLRAEFGYDFDATAAPLVRWGIEYGDGRSYTADTEAQARTQVFWHWYRSPGTFTVTAWVEDATGRRASDSCQFTWTQPPPPPPPRPATEGPVAGETASQENARESAARYLDLTSFSRSGLIEQLEFEGFTQAQAEYGVDALDVDWGEQAAKSAARYLDLTSFSRSGLIAQLEFEGFTQAQAEYGVGTTGL